MGAITLQMVERKLPSIKSWLGERGAEILMPTNEFEVLRFKAGDETGVVYRNGTSTRVTLHAAARPAIRAYFGGGAWACGERKKRKPNLGRYLPRIIERDGNRCFLCGGVVSIGQETVDHLVPLAHGGPNHIENFVLMDAYCNMRAGAMPAVEKINCHVAWRRGDT